MKEEDDFTVRALPGTRRTILVVDDHELVRIGMRITIRERFGDRFAVTEAATLEDALVFLNAHAGETALLLLDLQLDDSRGLTGLHVMRRSFPDLPVVIVSGSDDPRIRSEAALHGAAAYVPKDGGPGGVTRLMETIASIAAGEPRPAAPAVPARHAAGRAAGLRLTDRQVQVLELVLAGYDNRAIAEETGLAVGTVKNCVSAVFLAFNVSSRAELIAMFAS
ncbi:response regulator transcription factor [Ramlibacter pallidus]|uniref:Response regulator transcription factor n=1 Tax=Ramlibacter pallidus TaxID=2780087 RepID=A0ABR9S6A5_9BURK|nr:response regulator transcription factor [Ramlibacter pallidus]MBE7369055.1 response regulator transcription factor [Ramlibacter pallidus]